MLTGKNRTIACCLSLLILIATLSACDNGSDSATPQSPANTETGSVSFTVNWEDEPQAARSAYGRAEAPEETYKGAVDCVGRGIVAIKVALYNSNGEEIKSQEWPCENHAGTIEGIPAPQEGVSILLAAKDDNGNISYRGEKGALTINPGPNAAGAIDVFRFIPSIAEPGDTANSIQWNPIAGASSYTVEFSTAADFSTVAVTGECPQNSYAPPPADVSPETVYYVRIYARDSHGNESAASTAGSMTTIGLKPVPQNVTAQGDIKKNTVTWEGEADAPFNIYWSTTAGVTKSAHEGVIEVNAGTSHVHECQGNTTYYYVVTSKNSVGQESDISAEVSATAVGDPQGPENVTAEAGDRKVTLNWTAVPGFVYNIYWATEPGVSKTDAPKLAENLDGGTFVHENCASDTRYYYIVTAQNSIGESDPTGEVSAAPGWIELVDSPEWEWASDSSVDASGNLYLSGGTSAPFNGQYPAGEVDVLAAKLNQSGELQWAKLFGSTEGEWAHDSDVDAEGNSYIVGITDGEWHEGHTNTKRQVFLLKIDASGEQKWIRFPLEIEQLFIPELDVAVDASGNSYVIGTTPYNDDTKRDVFIAKYDADGGDDSQNPNWLRYLSSPEDEEAGAVTVDEKGDVYLTGGTAGELEGNPNATIGKTDIFVAKYAAADGTLGWVTLTGGTPYDYGYAVTVKNNDCYVAGAWAAELVVAKFNASDGAYQWHKIITEAEHTFNEDVHLAVGTDGNLIIGTDTRVEAFDGQANVGEPDDEGLYPRATLLMTYDGDGNRLWSKLYGSPDHDVIKGLSLDANGYLLIAGNTVGDFGGHQNQGSWGLFSWKYHLGP